MCGEAGFGGGGIEFSVGQDPGAYAEGLVGTSLGQEWGVNVAKAVLSAPNPIMSAYYGVKASNAYGRLVELGFEEFAPYESDPQMNGAVSLVPTISRPETVSSPDIITEQADPVIESLVSTSPSRASTETAEAAKSLVSVPRPAIAAAKRQTIKTGSLGLSGAPITEKKRLLGQGGKY